MKKLNIKLKDNQMYDLSKKNTYDKIRNHPLLVKWLLKYPKSEQEILNNIFKLEKMIKNEEEALLITNKFMSNSHYYETLDENFDFYYKKYSFIVEDEKQVQHQKGYLNKDIPYDFLKADLSSLLETENDDYKQVMQKIINAFLEKKGVYLYGEMGIGKTYLIHAFMNHLIKEYKMTCCSVRINDLIQNFNLRTRNSDEYMQYFTEITTVPVLLIDDIGSEVVDGFGRDTVLFSVLDERMKHRRLTYFTSNHNLKNLEVHFQESKYQRESSDRALRIIERIKTLSTQIIMNGKNRRY